MCPLAQALGMSLGVSKQLGPMIFSRGAQGRGWAAGLRTTVVEGGCWEEAPLSAVPLPLLCLSLTRWSSKRTASVSTHLCVFRQNPVHSNYISAHPHLGPMWDM
jgi:hypothetical protein